MPVVKLQPEIEQCVDLDAEVEWLVRTGLGRWNDNGTLGGVAEGPVWIDEEDCLVFSDNGNNRRYRWSARAGLEVDLEGTNDANGLIRDREGRLIACEHRTRRMTRYEHDGSVTVLADSYRGLRLNRPNDVAVSSDGAVYFTDPITMDVDSDLDFAGVFRISPDHSRIHCLVRDFVLPNGLCFSPDETTLYVNDSARNHIRAFKVGAIGHYNRSRIDLASDHVFCTVPGAPDGMKVDRAGNVWCTSLGGGDVGWADNKPAAGISGIWIITPAGEPLGRIDIPDDKWATSFCFGGPDLQTLYITTFDGLGRIPVRIPGHRPYA